jgi:hypothetical protein
MPGLPAPCRIHNGRGMSSSSTRRDSENKRVYFFGMCIKDSQAIMIVLFIDLMRGIPLNSSSFRVCVNVRGPEGPRSVHRLCALPPGDCPLGAAYNSSLASRVWNLESLLFSLILDTDTCSTTPVSHSLLFVSRGWGLSTAVQSRLMKRVPVTNTLSAACSILTHFTFCVLCRGLEHEQSQGERFRH